jgi:hypothetical protein
MFWRSKFGRVLILALAVGLGVPLTANAAFTLTLSSGGVNYASYTDDDEDGVISVLETDVNGFSLQGDIATSNALSRSDPAFLRLDQLSVRNWWEGGLRELTITIVDDGFTVPLGPVDVTTRLAAWDLLGNGDITTESYLNDESVGTVTLTESGQGSSQVSTNIEGTGYTLRSVTTIHLGRAGILLSSGSTEVTSAMSPVPAPATAVMALAGVPVLGAFGWFRRRGRPTPPPAA